MSLEADWSVGEKRLIFTVGTGRNGTGYVSHLLQGIAGICCLHEPDPQFYTVLRAAQDARDLGRREPTTGKEVVVGFTGRLVTVAIRVGGATGNRSEEHGGEGQDAKEITHGRVP